MLDNNEKKECVGRFLKRPNGRGYESVMMGKEDDYDDSSCIVRLYNKNYRYVLMETWYEEPDLAELAAHLRRQRESGVEFDGVDGGKIESKHLTPAFDLYEVKYDRSTADRFARRDSINREYILNKEPFTARGPDLFHLVDRKSGEDGRMVARIYCCERQSASCTESIRIAWSRVNDRDHSGSNDRCILLSTNEFSNDNMLNELNSRLLGGRKYVRPLNDSERTEMCLYLIPIQEEEEEEKSDG
jgi:hypothetical protein